MSIIVSQREVVKQSEQVYKQFGDKWIASAKSNSKLPHENVKNMRNCGIGKFLLLAAMGPSLEKHIDVIKKYRDKVDILTCDKGFGPLLERGIKADYVMICDTNIKFDWISKWIDKTNDVKLISTLYANPEWVEKWKGKRCFYVNRDAINTERIFQKFLPEDHLRLIPAGSNVSNAMLVFFTGSDEKQNVNWGGYEKYILSGYDYGWFHKGNYYAWADPKPKRHYMNHKTLVDIARKFIFTSTNLEFSAKWMYSYVTTHRLPVVNCSEQGLLDIQQNDLESELKNINTSARYEVIQKYNLAKKAYDLVRDLEQGFQNSRRLLYGCRG